MQKTFKLGIIGAGNMATAILGGILNNNILNPDQIIISDLDIAKLDIFRLQGVSVTQNNFYLVENSEYVLFAVKPQSFDKLALEIKNAFKDQKIITIMAATSINKIQETLGDLDIARIMPNTPALVSEGMSCIAFSKDFSSDFVKEIFNTLGKVIIIDETYFDAVTSLSGSGPAYVYLFIKSLINGGIDAGLDSSISKTLALQTVKGALKMVETSSLPIDELIDKVCSKGGTTIEAINSYKQDQLEAIVIRGMRKCKERSVELSSGLKKTNEYIIYTDGACSGNPGDGGWSAIIINNNEIKELFGAEHNTTNNRMELQAIISSLKSIPSNSNVKVYSDSAYSLNPITNDWITNWINNGWKTSSNEEVKNIDLWKELLGLINNNNISFNKVKGHSTDEYNNRCDKLAKDAIKNLK